MREERLAVLGLFLLAALAWAAPPLLERLRSRRPEPAVLYAPAPGRALVWSPVSTLHPSTLDGLVLGTGGRAAGPVGGWRGLLFGHPLDLNAATADDLEALPGVGPKTASAILDARRSLGGFRTAEDLLEVRGIGPKTLEKLRPLVTVGGPAR